ncbi:methyl-accepting chemotaxis protein [Halioxenophilus aromaticivorans]|uniref:Methyl-accepting chemotaxis protein n=1 Tax=Halioxenophilus aromaticivorans TaxID=1306992 RepID=A0AAV3TXP7_9ALTE
MKLIQLFKRSLARQLVLVLTIGTLLTLAITLVLAYAQFQQTRKVQTLLEVDTQAGIDILVLNTNFKIQVQEWKNTLLRGNNPTERTFYWQRFLDQEQVIKKTIAHFQWVLKGNTQHAATQQYLQQFVDNYPAMMTSYKAAYQVFIDSGSASEADQRIKGIDRQSTELLSAAAAHYIEDLRRDSRQDVDANQTIFQLAIPLLVAGQVLILILVTIAIKHLFVQPVQNLLEQLRRLRDKDYSEPAVSEQHNELGELSRAADRVRLTLVEMLIELDQSTVMISDMANNVSATSGGIASSCANVHASMDSALAASHQIHNSITTIADNSQNAVGLAQSVLSQTEAAKDTIYQTSKAMTALAQEIKTSSQAVMELEQNVAAVESVLDVIVSITEQTNLLALNAAIEAARAGDHGRGFAVVAGEVRALAQKTQSSTSQIQAIIQASQASTHKVVLSMQGSMDKAEKAVRLSSLGTVTIDQAQNAVQDMHSLNRAIAQHTDELNQASAEINDSLGKVNQSVDVNAEEATLLASATVELHNTVSLFDGIVQQYTYSRTSANHRETAGEVDLF